MDQNVFEYGYLKLSELYNPYKTAYIQYSIEHGYRPSNISSMMFFSIASQSMFPPLAYTLSYDDMLMLEKNGTKSRMLSI